MVNRAVFLDRDGTINTDPDGYIKNTKDFILFPFTAEAIRIMNNLNFKVIIVSNQAGVARGLMTINDVEEINNHMKNELTKEGVHIDLILYCPYHMDGTVPPFNIDHNSRKPKSGMFFEALKHFPIKANQSYMIGDKPSDIEFGKKNGLITFLVKTGEGEDTWEKLNSLTVKPDFVVDNLLSATKLIKSGYINIR